MIEVREFSDINDEGLAAVWADVEASVGAGLFGTSLWVRTWHRHFGRGLSPAVAVGFRGGRPVGLAPLLAPSPGRRVFPVNFLSPRGGLLVRSEDAPDFAANLLGSLRARGISLGLRGVPVGSDTERTLTSVARDNGYLSHARASRVSPFIAIESSWDDFYAGRPRKVTHEWERKMRKLERAGEVRVLRFEKGMDADRLVEEFDAVERRSWKEDSGTSMSQRGAVLFYRQLAEALARRGEFAPYWLELDGCVIAFIYGVVHGGTYYAMKTSYDRESSKLSPGVRLFHEAVRDAFGAGLALFDFLGERARWKDQWATGWTEHANVRLYPDTLGGRFAHLMDARVKPLARRVRDRRRTADAAST